MRSKRLQITSEENLDVFLDAISASQNAQKATFEYHLKRLETPRREVQTLR